MPGHFDCCTRPVLTWLRDQPDLRVSLLTQYVAPANVHGQLGTSLMPEDVDRARDLAHEYQLNLVS